MWAHGRDRGAHLRAGSDPKGLSSLLGSALNRNYCNGLCKHALVVAEIEPSRDNGSHALRHF